MRVDPLQILTKLAAVQNIPTRRVTPPFEGLEEFDYGLRRSLDPQFDWQEFGQLLLDSTPENTLLLVEGTFELHFALFRIPDEKNTVFLIGPWTVGPRTPSARKWVRRYLGEAGEAAVQEYYNGVKILEASDFYGALRVVVDTMFGCTVPVQELKEFLPFQFHPDTRYFHEPEFQKEIPVTMLEQRYESENRILDAVARGDEEAAIEAMHQHSRFTYGGRFEAARQIDDAAVDAAAAAGAAVTASGFDRTAGDGDTVEAADAVAAGAITARAIASGGSDRTAGDGEAAAAGDAVCAAAALGRQAVIFAAGDGEAAAAAAVDAAAVDVALQRVVAIQLDIGVTLAGHAYGGVVPAAGVDVYILECDLDLIVLIVGLDGHGVGRSGVLVLICDDGVGVFHLLIRPL